MVISASQVSELRKKTDCGFMDCKKALEEAQGDLNVAIDILRKKGIAKASRKADRSAFEGVVAIKVSDDGKRAVMLEVNSETDFVARDSYFQSFVEKVTALALAHSISEVNHLLALTVEREQTVEQSRQELVSKVGENICIRRIAFVETSGMIGSYIHGNKIGVLLGMIGGTKELAKDMAMHIAASKPLVVLPESLDPAMMEREKKIYHAQALESGKPLDIIDRMVNGRLQKFTHEMSLVGQPFVKNPDISVGSWLKQHHAQVEVFIRFELGEGIEKAELVS